MKRSALRGYTLAAALAAGAGGAGCGVPLGAAEEASPVNTCSAPSDCAQGAACSNGACVATSYDLTGLLLEVRPLPDATYGPGQSYLVNPAAGVSLASHGSGTPFVARIQAKLPAPVSIQNGLVVPDPSTGCVVPGTGIPANLTFYRISPYAGLSFDAVTASATNMGGTTPFTYSVALVPGTYDVYIEPQPIAACNQGAKYPPVFLPNQTIDASGAVSWPLPPVGVLQGSITGLSPVDAWKVDLVEPSRGLPISSGGLLTVQSGGAAVTAQISWTDPKLPPILRLTPKDPQQAGLAQPSIYWGLEGAVFMGTPTNPTVGFAIQGLQTDGVAVMGQVVGPDGVTGVASLLAFQSKDLHGNNGLSPGGNPAFALSNVATKPNGAFSVTLPPGDYDIRVVPQTDDNFSITDTVLTWPSTAASTCVCGQTIALQTRAKLSGAITTAEGQPLAGTMVGVTPSAASRRLFLAETHQLDPVATRVVSGTTDGAGSFSLEVDQGGTSNLVVQPDPSTRLPWLLRTNLSLTSDLSLEGLALSSPVFLGGTVLDPHGMPVADAVVDAWLPIQSSPPSAVQIATGSTDANGVFSLVLPSKL